VSNEFQRHLALINAHLRLTPNDAYDLLYLETGYDTLNWREDRRSVAECRPGDNLFVIAALASKVTEWHQESGHSMMCFVGFGYDKGEEKLFPVASGMTAEEIYRLVNLILSENLLD
jgi:hypothetical protein